MYGDFFDDLFDSLTQCWNRSFKEKDGYTIMEAKDHNGYLIIFNTLGVSSNDIQVTHSPVSQTKPYLLGSGEQTTFIRVFGSSKIPEMNEQLFSVNYELVFRNPNPIDSVQYKVRDGLTIVYIKTKEPESHSGTAAKKVEAGESLDW